jgi:hypothetical protein
VIFAISVCKTPIRKRIHTEIAKNAKERMTTDLRVTQTESVLVIFAISVCKTPIRKDNFTQSSQRTQRNGRTTDRRVTQTESVLVIFAISVCKTPIRNRIHTEIAKNAKERMTMDPRVTESKICLSDLCDLRV